MLCKLDVHAHTVALVLTDETSCAASLRTRGRGACDLHKDSCGPRSNFIVTSLACALLLRCAQLPPLFVQYSLESGTGQVASQSGTESEKEKERNERHVPLCAIADRQLSSTV